jgi:hypothetical protein
MGVERALIRPQMIVMIEEITCFDVMIEEVFIPSFISPNTKRVERALIRPQMLFITKSFVI